MALRLSGLQNHRADIG